MPVLLTQEIVESLDGLRRQRRIAKSQVLRERRQGTGNDVVRHSEYVSEVKLELFGDASQLVGRRCQVASGFEAKNGGIPHPNRPGQCTSRQPEVFPTGPQELSQATSTILIHNNEVS